MTLLTVEPWVQTVSGVAFDLLTPRAEDVRIDDVAISLARLNRYAGHTKPGLYLTGYNVADHSVLVSRIVEGWGAPLTLVREGLLHDAPEAYYGDVTSPVQRAIRELFRRELHALAESGALVADLLDGVADPLAQLKAIVDPVVRGALGLPLVESPLVKRADLVALACERHALMAPCERDWNLPEYADSRWRVITPEDPKRSRDAFIARLAELDERIAAGGA